MEPQQKAGLPSAEYFHLQGLAENLVDWNELCNNWFPAAHLSLV